MILLPKTYKGSIEAHKGKPMISWSQIETWNEKKGFNTGMEGHLEYMLKYFTGATFPDLGWGEFGTQVENYITTRGDADKFTAEERATLDKITPLGVFQQEGVIDFGDFVVLLYIDDLTPDYKILRDYKTKSESSKKDLHLEKKKQLDIYSMWVKQEKGFIPDKIEYCIIERLGGAECMKGGGRDVLKVGKQIWYEDYPVTEEGLSETKSYILRTVDDISRHYQAYLKFFNQPQEDGKK